MFFFNIVLARCWSVKICFQCKHESRLLQRIYLFEHWDKCHCFEITWKSVTCRFIQVLQKLLFHVNPCMHCYQMNTWYAVYNVWLSVHNVWLSRLEFIAIWDSQIYLLTLIKLVNLYLQGQGYVLTSRLPTIKTSVMFMNCMLLMV